jgi:TldD protein
MPRSEHVPQVHIHPKKSSRRAAASPVNFGGGSVDITSGKFVFSATEAYLIENGRVTHW